MLVISSAIAILNIQWRKTEYYSSLYGFTELIGTSNTL